jgi:hypothetical protein
MAITEYIQNVDLARLKMVFENVIQYVNKCLETGGDTLNIICNFLYFNHQVHRDFLITLYKLLSSRIVAVPSSAKFATSAVTSVQCGALSHCAIPTAVSQS